MGEWMHRLSEVDKEGMTAVCATCGSVALSARGGRLRCSVARRNQRGSRGAPKEPGVSGWGNAKGPHGLTLREARELREGKVCAICGGTERLCVDHDHLTGVIRGVLCLNCNNGLGRFKDRSELLLRAVEYLAG